MSFTLLETAWEDAPRPTPPGTTLFAVGDVHGHAAHLDALLAGLARPVREARERGDDVHLVLVGDYVDRGPSSLGTLDRLPAISAELGVDVRLLRGNHDRLLSDLLTAAEPDPEHLAQWLRKGGGSVVRELGLEAAPAGRRHSRPSTLIAALRERLGPARLGLLGRLADSWRCGAWLFVHAGVDPVRSLDAQDRAAWLTMREPFLSGAKWAHDFVVVHGHTVRGPEVLPHRVAVDSGAYRTGVLTAAEITGGRLRFRSVADRRNLASFRALPGSRQGRRFVRTASSQGVNGGRGDEVTASGRTSAAAIPSRRAGVFTYG
jgi:serine/threonine protein phosphatase 1